MGTWFLWDILNLEKDWSSPDFFDAVPLKFLRGEAMRGRLGKEDIPDVAGHGAIYPTPKLKIAQATLCPTSRGPTFLQYIKTKLEFPRGIPFNSKAPNLTYRLQCNHTIRLSRSNVRAKNHKFNLIPIQIYQQPCGVQYALLPQIRSQFRCRGGMSFFLQSFSIRFVG